MFVRTLDELRAEGKEKVLVDGRVRVVRPLTALDGLGFSLSDVSLAAGADATFWYKNHWEMNYVVSGRGEVEDLTSGESWPLTAGTLYTVGPRDRHRVTATEDLRAIRVFNPPVVGDESHDKDAPAFSISNILMVWAPSYRLTFF